MKYFALLIILFLALCSGKEIRGEAKDTKAATSRSELVQKILALKAELKRLQAETDAAAKVRDYKKAAKLDADSAVVVAEIANMEAEFKDAASALPSDSSKVSKQVIETCYQTAMKKINTIGGWDSTFKVVNTFIGAAAEFGIMTIEIRPVTCTNGNTIIAIAPPKTGEPKLTDYRCTPGSGNFCITIGGGADFVSKVKSDNGAKQDALSKYVQSVQDIFTSDEAAVVNNAFCSSSGRSHIAWHLLGRGFDVDLESLLNGRLVIDLWSPLNNDVKILGHEVQGGYLHGADLTFMDLIMSYTPLGCRFTF